MCFRFGSCFGSGSGQDYGRSMSKATHHGGGGGHRADHGYYSGADHKSGPQAYRQHQLAADETAGYAYNGGGVRKDHVGDAGGRGDYAPYVQDKANETLKHPAAWTGKVGDDAGHTHTARLQDAAADPRENAATGHHHYPATTTTAIARY